ncbi:MAG TPA: prepilin-type N-terminal cleavage/methylation domain-containing protein [Thermoanaerobaculia bacterium]|jgi:Tfp pilus assembly protein PilV|nr:prepilin-type N-terminal cleavage/methylation domain-containing protein [Thermoanaerobaculia bacterium]
MRSCRTGPASRRQSGFSMVEALIAAALIGVAAIGIIPLFTRAMTDNMAGADYTRVTNYAKSKEEDFARMPFTQPTIQLQSGTQLLNTEFLDPVTLQWTTTRPANPLSVWTRLETITQYNIYDTDDDQIFDFPLAAGSPVDEVQILQQQVQVKSVSPVGPAGAHRTTIIRFLKAF